MHDITLEMHDINSMDDTKKKSNLVKDKNSQIYNRGIMRLMKETTPRSANPIIIIMRKAIQRNNTL
jgi:hypothetical protein